MGPGSNDGGEYAYSGNERERGEGACEGVCVVSFEYRSEYLVEGMGMMSGWM